MSYKPWPVAQMPTPQLHDAKAQQWSQSLLRHVAEAVVMAVALWSRRGGRCGHVSLWSCVVVVVRRCGRASLWLWL